MTDELLDLVTSPADSDRTVQRRPSVPTVCCSSRAHEDETYSNLRTLIWEENIGDEFFTDLLVQLEQPCLCLLLSVCPDNVNDFEQVV